MDKHGSAPATLTSRRSAVTQDSTNPVLPAGVAVLHAGDHPEPYEQTAITEA
jgi:hypothetical protein